MRHTLSVLLFLGWFHAAFGQSSPAAQIETLNKGIQTVYDAIVAEDGSVDYAELHRRPELQAHLQAFIDFIRDFDPDTLSDTTEKIALLSNTYNVFTLAGVNRAWPVPSVRKIRPMFGFFTKKEWRVGGRKVSLNNVESDWLRPMDVRIHFIINCASVSCPRLDKRVLTAENVETVMEEATLRFLNNKDKNVFDETRREWHLSKIFDWYQKDWGKQPDVVAFVHKYRPDLKGWEPQRIRYLEYDWALNGSVSGETN
ncbi:DUF547 domain-containing protein [Sulfidibacter corallicola]|uniref:DUF547 domain-containing protein n=1 Tax=Sulfidibacter corallicola TaxID=2818388 RepID=A0A8A4TS62_SULCO|nr:DUF547 domain-containing protein [Sulfidibacter corallicola]QTD52353.1 DUF547 domain-containing protein [Sulfidibacter corallicola]